MNFITLTMIAVVLGGPAQATDAQRLERHIVSVYHGAESYAAELAERIVWEAGHHRLPVELLAAVAHNESWYQLSARGTSGERGLWQVLPDADWRLMTRADQDHWSRDIVYSTARAAALLAYWYHRGPPCHYNSGYARCRPSYRAALRSRSRAIRLILRP